MSRYAILREIQKLDPEKDDQCIVFLSSRYELPFDTSRALEFALFRTFCVPSISALLDRTGEFHHRAQKRYDDTDLIVSELMTRKRISRVRVLAPKNRLAQWQEELQSKFLLLGQHGTWRAANSSTCQC